jgi:hypothetical protein
MKSASTDNLHLREVPPPSPHGKRDFNDTPSRGGGEAGGDLGGRMTETSGGASGGTTNSAEPGHLLAGRKEKRGEHAGMQVGGNREHMWPVVRRIRPSRLRGDKRGGSPQEGGKRGGKRRSGGLSRAVPPP